MIVPRKIYCQLLYGKMSNSLRYKYDYKLWKNYGESTIVYNSLHNFHITSILAMKDVRIFSDYLLALRKAHAGKIEAALKDLLDISYIKNIDFNIQLDFEEVTENIENYDVDSEEKKEMLNVLNTYNTTALTKQFNISDIKELQTDINSAIKTADY